MIMNGLESRFQEFGLYPNRLWRAIGGCRTAAQLGYSMGTVQIRLSEKY